MNINKGSNVTPRMLGLGFLLIRIENLLRDIVVILCNCNYALDQRSQQNSWMDIVNTVLTSLVQSVISVAENFLEKF